MWKFIFIFDKENKNNYYSESIEDIDVIGTYERDPF